MRRDACDRDEHGSILAYRRDVSPDAAVEATRHCLQALWKVGAAGEAQRAAYQAGMVRRFTECGTEKNWSLIRFDVLQSMRNVSRW